MATIEFEEGAIRIDATIIGQGLSIEPSLVQVRMREGKIATLCDRGVDEDAGRYRLTFIHKNRRFRLVFDEEGNAVQRSTINFGAVSFPLRHANPARDLIQSQVR
jgi:Family of unknown function (DUF6522)